MIPRASINSAQVTVEDVWDYYETARDNIVQSAEIAKRSLPDASNLRDSRLFGKSLSDIERLLDEADKQASLFIIAAAEAKIRIDFYERVLKKKPKDSVTLAFRRLYSEQGKGRVRLEAILDVWANETPESKADAGRFKGALKFRNWLAHGRWWTPKLGRTYDPSGLVLVIESLFTRMGINDS